MNQRWNQVLALTCYRGEAAANLLSLFDRISCS